MNFIRLFEPLLSSFGIIVESSCCHCGQTQSTLFSFFRKQAQKQWLCSNCQLNDCFAESEDFYDQGAAATNTRYFTTLQKPIQKPSFFCDVCIQNQNMILQLMSSYLPDEDDPDYAYLLSNVSEYKASLESRYPPVCNACQPLVSNYLSLLAKNYPAPKVTSAVDSRSPRFSKAKSSMLKPFVAFVIAATIHEMFDLHLIIGFSWIACWLHFQHLVSPPILIVRHLLI
jgi:hypothetical protein